MRNFFPSFVAILALSAVAPASAATTFYFTQSAFITSNPTAALLEDFESVTGGQLDTTLPQLVRASGTYTGLAGVPFPNVFVSSPGYTNFGAGNNPTTTKILSANGDESFDVALSSPTTALGMNFYLNDFGPATVEFFDATNVSLGSITYFAAADNFQFGGVTVDGGQTIARFTFVSTNGGILNTGIDNLYAVQNAVPEASVWTMLIVGFSLSGVMLRRKHTMGRARLA